MSRRSQGDSNSGIGAIVFFFENSRLIVELKDLAFFGSDLDSSISSSSAVLGLNISGKSHLLPVDTMPSEDLAVGSGDPWATIGLNSNSGGNLGSDLRPGLAIPSVWDTLRSKDPDGTISSRCDVDTTSRSLLPLNSLKREASFHFIISIFCCLLVGDSSRYLSY